MSNADLYEVYRSQRDHKDLHVIHYAERFYEDVPDEIRHKGPWWGTARGNVADLKLPYRVALERDGYAIIVESMITFEPEPTP